MEEMITGLGGVFIKTENPEKSYQWYRDNFGLNTSNYGKSFEWRNKENPEEIGTTQFSLFSNDSDYFGNPNQKTMLNFRVKDLKKLLEHLEVNGIKALKPMEEFEYGKFCWIEDPDGNRIELWEPADESVL